MSRPDLGDSDLAGLDHTYAKICAERRLAPPDEMLDEDPPASAWETALSTYGPPIGVAVMVGLCVWFWL